MHFNILNRSGVAHECDGQMDGRIKPPLATVQCTEAH